MNVIFLDIDGVLNCERTKERCRGMVGINPGKVELLKQTVDAVDASLVLVSSWKMFWEPQNKDLQDPLGDYIDESLGAFGLSVIDKTEDYGYNRGEGIIDYLSEHNVDKWVILDDDVFPDYEETGCLEHLVRTNWADNGLTEKHCKKVINLFNKQSEPDSMELAERGN